MLPIIATEVWKSKSLSQRVNEIQALCAKHIEGIQFCDLNKFTL